MHDATSPALPPAPPPAAPGWDRPATCPRCGSGFACGAARPAGAPCACAGVRLAPAQRAALATRYASCLCLACLRAVGEGAPG